jgi:hypothetical protein
MGVAAVALINIIALSNVRAAPRARDVRVPTALQRSYIWTRMCKFLWPLIVVIAAIRAILMIVELERKCVPDASCSLNDR